MRTSFHRTDPMNLCPWVFLWERFHRERCNVTCQHRNHHLRAQRGFPRRRRQINEQINAINRSRARRLTITQLRIELFALH